MGVVKTVVGVSENVEWMEMVDIVHITSEQEKMLNCSNGPFSSMIYID